MMIMMDQAAAQWFLLQTLLIRTMNENAERINGWAAMLGIVAAMGAYAVTGDIIPGLWWACTPFGLTSLPSGLL